MFQSLGERLQNTFRRLRGRGKLTEADVNEALREVRMALLEADVNFRVVKRFIDNIRERAVGQEVLRSITPGQQVVKIVHDELTRLLGGETAHINMASEPPTVIILCGLQGAGKTTTAGKLGAWLRKNGRSPLLVAADTQRPAAVEQLQTIGRELDLPVYAMGTDTDPVSIARASISEARRLGRDVVIIDTAGRLQIDAPLMEQLKQIRQAVNPQEVLLVVDAMTGQEAVNIAEQFNNDLQLTGAILTKLDGDTRGGAALSLLEVTGCPIKFVGVGERAGDLEPFHPERMASRILGMGDVLSLVEKAQAAIDKEEAAKISRKLTEAEFDLEDFLQQMQQMRRMGPLDQLLNLLPGGASIGRQLKGINIDEKSLRHVEAIIQSMTPEERRNPDIINASRKRRIAKGSGRSVQEVNRLLKQFRDSQKIIKQLSSQARAKGRKGMRLPGFSNFPFSL